MKNLPQMTKVFFLLWSLSSTARGNFTLSGVISDEETGARLPGVTVLATGIGKSAETNKNGYYALKLPAGNHSVRFQLKGFKVVEKQVWLTDDVPLDIPLSPKILHLKPSTVRNKKGNDNIRNTEMSVDRFRIEELNLIPVIMGEKDIMKTIQLVPGITTITEGRSAFITRGSGIDQNTILFDGMPIYYTSHMSGLYSIFNSESVDKLAIYKGGIPARYGGRAASVMDVTMKESDPKRYHASLGVGLITSKLTLQMPVVKEKLSLFVSGRGTEYGLGHQVDKSKTTTDMKGQQVSLFFPYQNKFYDVSGKIAYQMNGNNRFSVSGFSGHDDEWSLGHWLISNDAASFQWKHNFHSRLFSNTTLYYSKYATQNFTGWEFNSWIRVRGLRQKFTWQPDKSNTVSAGAATEYQDFNHGGLTDRNADTGGKFMPPMQGFESALFLENEQRLSEKLGVYYGLRYSTYHQVGPGDNVYYNEYNDSIRAVYHEELTDVMTFHHALEPRLSISYMLSEANSLKATYNRTAQYVRLMTNSMQLEYYDIWLPATHNIKPIRTDQIAGGYFHNFFDNSLKFSAETYYKWAHDDADFEDGLHNYFVNNLEAFVATGRGRSYGLELLLKKPKGRMTGWLSYNLSRSKIQIDAVNQGRWYTSKFDKCHDFTFITNIKLVKGLSLSANWLYSTGNAVTLPEATYLIKGRQVLYYEGRNKYRLPDYHRLDLGLIIDKPFFKNRLKRWDRSLNTRLEVSLYNAYNRRNINAMRYTKDTSPGAQILPSGLSLYGFMPNFLLIAEF